MAEKQGKEEGPTPVHRYEFAAKRTTNLFARFFKRIIIIIIMVIIVGLFLIWLLSG